MRTIEKITLVLFSTLILMLSLISFLLVFGWLDFNLMTSLIEGIITDSVSSNVVLTLDVIFVLLAIKCIFFDSSNNDSEEYKRGILLESTEGKLLITKETIENLVNNVVKGFDSVEDITNKIVLCEDNTVRIYVSVTVMGNAVIKELSSNLQTKIKESIKKTTDLEVKEVNIKVKNIEPVKDIIK